METACEDTGIDAGCHIKCGLMTAPAMAHPKLLASSPVAGENGRARKDDYTEVQRKVGVGILWAIDHATFRWQHQREDCEAAKNINFA